MQENAHPASFFVSDHAVDQAEWPLVQISMPAIPDPVPVFLDGGSTALIVSDLTHKIFKDHARRAAHIPAITAALLVRARAAGTLVVYTARAEHASDWLAEVSPAEGDPFVASHGQDRFHASELEHVLRARGIATVLLTGWKISGSLLYTAIGANLLGFTAIVPVDTTSAPVDVEVAIGMYQLLNQFHGNARNEACRPRAVTLTRSDLVSFS